MKDLNKFEIEYATNLCNHYKEIMEKSERTASEEFQYFVGKQLLFYYYLRNREAKEVAYFNSICIDGMSIEEYGDYYDISAIEIYRQRVRIYRAINKINVAVFDYFYDDSLKEIDQLDKDVKKKIYLAACEFFIKKQDFMLSTVEKNKETQEREFFYRDLVDRIRENGIEDLIINHSDLLNKYHLREFLHVDQFLEEFEENNNN